MSCNENFVILNLFRALSPAQHAKVAFPRFAAQRYPHKTVLEKAPPEAFISSPQGKDAPIGLAFYSPSYHRSSMIVPGPLALTMTLAK